MLKNAPAVEAKTLNQIAAQDKIQCLFQGAPRHGGDEWVKLLVVLGEILGSSSP